MVTETVKEDTGEGISCDVEQRNSSVVVADLPVSLPFVEANDSRIVEILMNLSVMSHLMNWRGELLHNLGAAALRDFRGRVRRLTTPKRFVQRAAQAVHRSLFNHVSPSH
nr:unnamed protein product [Spirometra erinaceieuropaei]